MYIRVGSKICILKITKFFFSSTRLYLNTHARYQGPMMLTRIGNMTRKNFQPDRRRETGRCLRAERATERACYPPNLSLPTRTLQVYCFPAFILLLTQILSIKTDINIFYTFKQNRGSDEFTPSSPLLF